MEISEPPAKRRKITSNAGHRPVTRASLARAQQDNSILPAYTYRDLKKEDEIRIFKVEKTGPQEWQYDIEHTTLTDAPPFETVSYVWGPDTRQNIIRLRAGRTIRVNDSLSKALPYLSAECKTGYLWIDQININQSSTHERNHQVKMMGDIYKKGERVIAWLGMAPKPSEKLIALIEVARFSLELRETVSLTKERIKSHLLHFCHKDFAVISTLLESAWFSRAWVFQEIVLSKHATFLFGSIAIPFLALVWVSRVFSIPEVLEIAQIRCARSSKSAQGSSQLTSFYDITSTVGYNTLTIMHRSWHTVSHALEDIFMPFLWTLSKVSPMLQTTDPRDSVYAFLGLQTRVSGAEPIQADYHSTYEEVLINTANSVVKSTASLDILAYCGREGSSRLLSRNLPSWVPEWKAPASTPLLMINPAGNFYLGARSQHKWVQTPHPSELRVRGVRLDTITKCFTPEFRFRSSDWYDENLEGYLALDQRLASIQEHISQCSRERLFDVLMTWAYRPDVNDKGRHVSSSDHSVSDLMDFYDKYVAQFAGSHVVDASRLLHALRHLTYLLNTRQLFLTEDGHIGHVRQPSGGDIICGLEGYSHLLTLRPCGNDRFTVVGTCHVESTLWNSHAPNDSFDHYLKSLWEKQEGEEFILV